MGQKANAPLQFMSVYATNFRSLGGYDTVGGRVTREGVIYRSDALSDLEKGDIEKIRALGITDVIDLRDGREIISLPNSLAEEEGFRYHHMPLFVDITAVGAISLDSSLYASYLYMLDSLGERIAAVLRTILKAKGGAVFHCYAGKDRTGITAMLLLKLAGVSEDTIVKDYSVSYDNIRARLAYQESVEERFLRSDAENMRGLLNHLEEKYQTVENYLSGAGLTCDEIQGLKQKLLA